LNSSLGQEPVFRIDKPSVVLLFTPLKVMTINVIGLDISKETIDTRYLKEGKWLQVEVPNGPEGFRVLDKLAVGGDFLYVMEATGPYYLQVAMYLHGHLQISLSSDPFSDSSLLPNASPRCQNR
jgi:hypothetical protein